MSCETSYNKIIKVIKNRRSIRKFEDKKIPRELIEKILEAGVYAPSAMHVLPWRFVVIEDKIEIKRLSEKSKETLGLLGFGMRFAERVTSRKDTIFYDAPLLVFIACEKKLRWRKEDTALCVENMFLCAESLGMGSCWIGFAEGLNSKPELLKNIGIPPDYEITAALIFGYPTESEKNKQIPKREVKILKWI